MISGKVFEFVETLHLTELMIMGSKKRPSRFSRVNFCQIFCALVCIALIFFVTLAQALDSHELKLPHADRTNVTRLANASPGFCLVCIAAHSPSEIAHAYFIHFVAKSHVSESCVAIISHSLLGVFDLSVRPPPIA
jgi:hypothetical protein